MSHEHGGGGGTRAGEVQRKIGELFLIFSFLFVFTGGFGGGGHGGGGGHH